MMYDKMPLITAKAGLHNPWTCREHPAPGQSESFRELVSQIPQHVPGARSITQDQLRTYVQSNYTADRIVPASSFQCSGGS